MTSARTNPTRYALAFCLALAVLLAAPGVPALAQPTPSGTTHTVTTLVDELDASADPLVGAGASLREILTYSQAAGDRIVFDPGLSGSLFLTLGQLEINADLILEGPGSDVIELNGNDLNRILWIDTTVAVAVSGLTLASGRAVDGAAIWSMGWLSLTDCAVRWSTAVQRGGAIYHEGGALLLSRSRFEHNEAYIHGGAVALTAGSATVDSCLFSNNHAGGDGGAMYLADAGSAVTRTTMSENSALGSGGAIAVAVAGGLDMTASTLDANTAGNGGGIQNSGTLTLTNSTVSGNTANNAGGGLRSSGTATLDFSTIARNSAASGGGAAASGSFATGRSILAENSAGSGPDVFGSVTSNGTNLVAIRNGSSGWNGTDITGTSDTAAVAALDDLRLNGGDTRTHALLACSRAIDAASNAGLPATDQRGVTRSLNGNHDGLIRPDIGAYELPAPLDNQPPTLNPNPAYTVFLDSLGTATVSADKLLVGAFDNCGIRSTSVSKTNFTCADKDTVSITVQATDINYNMSTMQIKVAVVDNWAPSFTFVPADATFPAGASGCAATLTIAQLGGYATAFDGCGPVSITSDAPPGNVFPIGVTIVTWQAEDGSGNVSYAHQIVTVNDVTAPTISAPAAVSVDAPANACQVSRSQVILGAATANDNCAAEITNDAPAVFPLGTTTVTWTATDPSGNFSTATQDVTVHDVTAPAVFAPADLVLIADPGSCSRDSANVDLGAPVVSDNCSVSTVVASKPASFPIGETFVNWTATDGSGNVSVAVQKVTIFDGIPPTISAPADIEVEADPGQCYWTVVPAVLGTATNINDNCSVPTVNNSAGSALAVGTHRVIWTAIDGNGNRTTDVQIVTVVGEPPTIMCPSDITVSTDPGKAGAVVTFSPPTTGSTCSDYELIRTGGLGSGDFFPVGTTTVSYMVIDGSNQIATCSFDVTVEDNEDPQISVSMAPRYLWPANNQIYDVEATVVVWDNVPGAAAVLTSITCNQNANGDIFGATTGVFDRNFELRAKNVNGPRIYTVTYTATDVAGNYSSASATVTVPTQKPKDLEETGLPVPTSLSLEQNYPNPFNPSTLITFGTPVEQHVELRVFNAMGQQVRTLYSGTLPEGSYTVEWDGTDDNGAPLGSGVYLYMLRAGGEQSLKKMILAR